MPLIAKQNASGHFDPIPPDTYQAVCYSVIDFGTQYSEKYDKNTRKVLIGWEIPELRIQKEDEDTNRPRVISQTYTLSLHEKSRLYNDLISWRGRPFTAEELDAFDLFNVLGANCLIQVVNTEKNGKTYSNVQTVSKLMKNMQAVKPENPILKYSFDDDKFNIPEEIYDWCKDIIKRSVEFQAVKNAQESTALAEAQSMMENDEIPF